MTDRLAELGALQWAVENLATAGTNPNRLGLAGYIHAAYTDYQTWAAANPGVNPNRLSARGRLYGYFYDNAGVTDPDAVITALFASGEQGAWYDPSDLSTMFQDSAGTTPVTADGQPVGLILDNSKGLVLGANNIPNATDWSNPTNGVAQYWITVGAISASVIDGTANGFSGNVQRIQNGAGGGYQALLYNQVATAYPSPTGKTYKFTGKYRANYPVRNARGAGFDFTLPVNTGVAVQFVMYWRPTQVFDNETMRFIVGMDQNYPVDGYLELDEVSLQELPGNHASQATAASRPLYKTTGGLHWLQFDGVDDRLVSASVDMTSVTKPFIASGVKINMNGYPIYMHHGPAGIWDTTQGTLSLQNATGKSKHGLISTTSASAAVGETSVVAQGTNYITACQFEIGPATVQLNVPVLNLNGTTSGASRYGYAQTTGTLSNNPITLGGNSGGGSWLNGNIYSIIILGRRATTQEITDTETWVAAKTGISL